MIRFDVELEKAPGTRMNIKVMIVTGDGLGGLVVEQVSEGGSVDEWNKRSSRPEHRFPAGDCIVQVNGVGIHQSLTKMADVVARAAGSASRCSATPPQTPESRPRA